MVRAVMGLVLGMCVAGAPAQATASPGGASIVRVTTTQAGGGERVATGVVVGDGLVVTTLGAVEDAATVKVIGGDGAAHEARGIAGYHTMANLVLLSVDWGGEAPAALPIAAQSPAEGAELKILRPGAPDSDAKAEAQSDRAQFVFQTDAKVDRTWGGAPLVSDGKVVGVVTGVHPIPDVSPDEKVLAEATAFDAARPEILRSLKPTETIPWDHWKEQRENFARASALERKAAVADRKGDLAAAIDAEREALKLDPRCWRCWAELSHSLRESGDEDESLRAAERAIELMPTDAYAYTMKACILAKQGRVDEGVAVAKRAVQIAPGDSTAHTSLAYAIQYSGDMQGAAEEYQKAIKLDPQNEYAKRELERLKEYLDGSPDGAAKGPRF